MADRWMPVVALLACAGGLLACGGGEQALRLDEVCNQPVTSTGAPPCRLSGDAQETTGLTGDALAIRLGSAGGALEIRLNALGAPMQQTWSLDVLAAARPLRADGNLLVRRFDFASCDPLSCPEEPVDTQAALDEDYQWAVMVETIPGSNGAFIPDAVHITLEGADIDIADIRTPGFDASEETPPFPTPR